MELSPFRIKTGLIAVAIIAIILANFAYYIHRDKEKNPEIEQATNIQAKAKTASKNPAQKSETPAKKDSTPAPTPSDEDTEDEGADFGDDEEWSTSSASDNASSASSSSQNSSTTTKTVTSSTVTSGETTKTPSNTHAELGQVFTDQSWSGNRSAYAHYWGSENVAIVGETMKVLYPKGSNSPSNSPRGGAGFIYNLPTSHDKISMSYTIKFEDGFDFVKGGKLPGLCGGNCSRGASTPTTGGFSVRFAWKKNGYLDVMTFVPNTVKPGNYTGVKLPKLEPGKIYVLTQQIVLNDIGKQNGYLAVLLDGKKVYEKSDVTFRVSPSVHIDSFLFSTFFGGSNDTYSATKDEYAYFGKFKISENF